MLNKVFEYAGSYKKSIHLASFIMLISVIMVCYPFYLHIRLSIHLF